MLHSRFDKSVFVIEGLSWSPRCLFQVASLVCFFSCFRKVHEILKEDLTVIHAFSQKTYTPSQWEEIKAKEQGGAGAGEQATAV
jgi:hypothetical protein